MEQSVRAEHKQIDTIIDLDRQELLSILRDVQEHSVPAEYTVDPTADLYIDRHLT